MVSGNLSGHLDKIEITTKTELEGRSARNCKIVQKVLVAQGYLTSMMIKLRDMNNNNNDSKGY